MKRNNYQEELRASEGWRNKSYVSVYGYPFIVEQSEPEYDTNTGRDIIYPTNYLPHLNNKEADEAFYMLLQNYRVCESIYKKILEELNA